MKPSLLNKLENISERHTEIEGLLSEASVIMNQRKFRQLSVEYSQIEPVVNAFRRYEQVLAEKADAEEMLSEPEFKEMAQEEIQDAKKILAALALELQTLLLPKDPHDTNNVFLEIRAGTGGDEAAIFAGDLFRMYARYAEQQQWQIEIVNQNAGEHGGFKEIIGKISGTDVYSRLKFESGAHRVQRVPETESQGRVHTSAATVAIMPEVDAIEAEEINPKDLRIDTFRASGAGGQHINKTDSAIRLTHLPTGLVVECQDERSQHKNKARAMSLLQARLLETKRKKQAQEQAASRKSLVGSGDRSERIRTYNFPQGRMTDHRINLTLYKLDDIMTGSLNQIIKPLINEHQMDQLATLSE